ncbi:MAG: hypothetical protein JW991_00130 [Candidatus Pacebacteria bacterium]|nr:hypothetical protein [Candidatus Paceibacterota bacterium]
MKLKTRLSKKIRLGFDLDGVIVDKPRLVPKSLLERLFKGSQKGLNYRFPGNGLEQVIRRLSHFYLFRPPLKGNIKVIRKIKRKRRTVLYLISSRYFFLEKETRIWLKKRKIDDLFDGFILNLKNEQPHLFKERMIKKLKLDYYFEDDPLIVGYLKSRIKKTRIFLVKNDGEEALLKLGD